MGNFIIKRIQSIRYAIKGFIILVSTEPSIQVQFTIAIIMAFAGFYFHISSNEWMFQILVIGLIMGLEGINTAIEKTVDFIHPEHHHKIARIKDIAAGSVLITACAAIIVGGIIYIPKIF
ncbi:diacylglycerol kinase family protein [Leptobacterium sp. I13]|uniref:diacylglycerol kinase n=1 Tax=Leptobacterium meishanense TaxID=3128904 RepID=UPI0030EBDF06